MTVGGTSRIVSGRRAGCRNLHHLVGSSDCRTFPTATQNVDIAKLAGRVQRGEMVLFLGSGIICLCAMMEYRKTALGTQLAQQIGYEQFNGTLSSIAEYYQLRPDFGQSALLENLRAQFAGRMHKVVLCIRHLAKVQAPLILISAAYDNLLESVFREAGKRFVELASIVRRSDEYDIGHVLVSFSDDSQPTKVYPEEELSRLKFAGEWLFHHLQDSRDVWANRRLTG